MATEQNAAIGLAQIMADYRQYVQQAKAQNQKPLSILAYLAETFQ